MKPLPPVAAISFDIDHTLIDFDAVLANSLAQVSKTIASEFSVQVSAAELAIIGDKTATNYEGDSADFLKIRKLSFHNFLKLKQLDTNFTDALFDIFIEERFRKTIFMPGAEELLSSIPESMKIAVLSNGNSDPERLGFAHYFDEILIGKDLEHKKPNKGAFSQLMTRLNISDPAHILHVGDSLHDDIQGAYAAGLQTVWFNPNGLSKGDAFSGHYEVARLQNILSVILWNHA